MKNHIGWIVLLIFQLTSPISCSRYSELLFELRNAVKIYYWSLSGYASRVWNWAGRSYLYEPNTSRTWILQSYMGQGIVRWLNLDHLWMEKNSVSSVIELSNDVDRWQLLAINANANTAKWEKATAFLSVITKFMKIFRMWIIKT